MCVAILGCVRALALLTVFLRMYVFFEVTQVFALIVAIMSTFVSTSESEIEERINEPGSILQIATVFKIMKCCLTIMVFTYNGNVNDYFVGLFFFYTGHIGINYYLHAGLYMPHKAFHRNQGED